MYEEFILKLFRRRVDTMIEKIKVAILNQLTILYLFSYFIFYFLKLKLILFYNWVVYYYTRIFLIFLPLSVYLLFSQFFDRRVISNAYMYIFKMIERNEKKKKKHIGQYNCDS